MRLTCSKDFCEKTAICAEVWLCFFKTFYCLDHAPWWIIPAEVKEKIRDRVEVAQR